MSSTELVRAWLLERYPARVYVPLAALLFVVGAVALGVPTTPIRAAAGIGLAWTLVLAFRLWDDLIDGAVDRVHHPERVVSRAERVTPMVAFAVALSLVSIALLAQFGRGGLVLLAALGAVITLWYAARARVSAGPLANAHVLMLKYPAIALIANMPALTTRPATAPMVAALAALYLGLCLHEMLDDPTIRARPATPWAVRIELALLGGLQVLTLSSGGLTS